MRDTSRRFSWGLFLAGFLLIAAFSAWAQVSFRGRLFIGGARGGAVNVGIDIESYSSPEELQFLKQHLGLSDVDGFFGAFRAMKKGAIRYLGGEGLNEGFEIESSYSTPLKIGDVRKAVRGKERASQSQGIFR